MKRVEINKIPTEIYNPNYDSKIHKSSLEFRPVETSLLPDRRNNKTGRLLDIVG